MGLVSERRDDIPGMMFSVPCFCCFGFVTPMLPQELIPEFYAGDGSFLTNSDDLQLGVTQVSRIPFFLANLLIHTPANCTLHSESYGK